MNRPTRGHAGTPGEDPWNRPLRLVASALALFAVSLLLHGMLWWQYLGDPFHQSYVSDALSYHEWAERIVGGGVAAEPVFHQAPLFPLVLAGLYAAGGGATVDGAILLQVLLTSLAIATLVPIGRFYLGSGSTGLAAGAAALSYAPLAFYSLKLLPIPLAIATQAVGLALLGAARFGGSAGVAAAAGVVCGLACLTRSEFLLFLPFAVYSLWRDAAGGARARRTATVVFALGAVVTIAPATLHNRSRGDRVLIASSAGENLFIGNQRGGDGGHAPLHPQAGDLFSQRRLAERLAEQDEGRPLRPSEVSAYWRRRAVEEIRADPLAWLRLESRKLGRILDPRDPTDMYSFPLERSLYLGSSYLAPLSTSGLWLLAGIGACLAFKTSRRSSWPLTAMVAVQLLVLMAFFVSTRIRMPLLFWLTPFAGLTFVEGVRRVRERRGLLAVGVAALLLAVGSVHWLFFVGTTPREAVRLASVLSRQERLDESLEILEPWIRGDDADALALDQAGWVHSKSEDLSTAVVLYRRALEAGLPSPEREAQTRSRLAGLHERLGENLRAQRQHDEAVRAAPESAGARQERGLFFLRQGRSRKAIADLTEAARLAPDWPDPRRVLRSLGAPLPTPEPFPPGTLKGQRR